MSAQTANQISYFRYASIKGRLSMESKGIKFRGGAVRPRIATELGLSARASYPVFIAEVQKRMDELLKLEQQQNQEA